MLAKHLALAGVLAFATVTPTNALFDTGGLFGVDDDGDDDGLNLFGNLLGNTFDQLDEITNEIFEGFGGFELGVGDADLEALISGIFSSMAGWFDNMFLAFDFDTIASLVVLSRCTCSKSRSKLFTLAK